MNGSVILDEGIQYRVPFPVKASTTLEANSAVALKGGELQPATSTLFASGGAITFQGITFDQTKNDSASAQSFDPPVLVRQGCTWEANLDAADPPTVGELYTDIAISTAISVKKTVLGTDRKVKLLELLPGNRALVYVYPPLP